MPRLTASQIKCMIPAQHALEKREIVVLKGGANGKTRLAYEMQEALGYVDGAGRYRTRNHPENPTVEFMQLAIPGYYSMHEIYFMRQIVKEFTGEAPNRGDNVKEAFNLLLRNKANPHDPSKPSSIICVVIDNAEILPARAYPVIKALNEKRMRTRVGTYAWIGCAFLLSGKYHKMKADFSFFRHATEINVGRIHVGEMRELIENRYAAQSMHFNDKAMERLANLETTNDVHAAVRQALMIRREERSAVIDDKLMDKAIKRLIAKSELAPSLQY